MTDKAGHALDGHGPARGSLKRWWSDPQPREPEPGRRVKATANCAEGRMQANASAIRGNGLTGKSNTGVASRVASRPIQSSPSPR